MGAGVEGYNKPLFSLIFHVTSIPTKKTSFDIRHVCYLEIRKTKLLKDLSLMVLLENETTAKGKAAGLSGFRSRNVAHSKGAHS